LLCYPVRFRPAAQGTGQQNLDLLVAVDEHRFDFQRIGEQTGDDRDLLRGQFVAAVRLVSVRT